MFELYHRYTYSAPEGSISDTGIRQILDLLARQNLQDELWKGLNPKCTARYMPTLPDDWSWVWLVSGKGEYVGTMPKRVGKYYYKAHSLKVPPAVLSEIGNIARQHSETALTYTFEFVDEFDWYAGDFGDGSSCFWGSNEQARDILRDNGAWAVCFYKPDGQGLARAWGVEIDDKLYVIFNGYGFPGSPTLVIARIIASWLGLSYKKIWLSNNGRDNGVLWVNSGIGYVIGSTEAIEHIRSHDLQWDEPYLDHCYQCGTGVPEHEIYIGADDETYCQDCFYAIFERCESCDETYWRDDVYYVDGFIWCEHCLERNYTQCSDCGDWTKNPDIVEIEGQVYCPDCAPQE